jgi:ribonuclease Z
MATDYMVWNVTKDDIRVRMAVIDEDIWPQPAVGKKLPPDRSKRIGVSEFVLSGREAFPEIVQKVYDAVNAKHGTDYEVPND